LRVAFISDRDVRSAKASAHYAMFRALEPRVDSLTHIRTSRPPGLLGKVSRKLRGEVRKFDETWVKSRIQSAQQVLSREFSDKDYDIVFAPMGSIALAALKTELPIVYTSDATVRLMDGYYESHTGLPEGFKQFLNGLEQDAIRSAVLITYPSQWAADSAINHYNADPASVRVIPYGANIDRVPEDIERTEPGARLLLIGLEWHRKGADIAVETVRLLRERGINASLTLMGCNPPGPIEQEGVTLEPFFDKGTPDGMARFERAMRESDILILPSKAECYGHVMCEAAAYGMPLLANRTGGLAEIVQDGKTGYLVDADEGAEGYAARVERMLEDPATYPAMSRAVREDFDNRLNWNSWADSLVKEMRSCAG